MEATSDRVAARRRRAALAEATLHQWLAGGARGAPPTADVKVLLWELRRLRRGCG